ncbi:hypothetical protein [Salibacterium halotolerans]|uniref:Sporulation lipoprotein YhcN/YlaJ (Spore_YhcN_YlaJ) n=1 Tax=Salibacterium halotolerans TaxID=1884432 RepID=A0A1I5V3Q6_9BACI|nr:hypothetical protein [Salibacterium halotolerans]SFQ02012.1 hypothetical protein SAMN05518683_11511 [Salibacterium halotolerans]
MKYIVYFLLSVVLLSAASCEQDKSPQAGPLQSPEPAAPSDYNQGPGNVSMTTNEYNQGDDNDRVKDIARRIGFSPKYVMFGGRHAYLYTTSDTSWDKEEKKKKQQQLKRQYKQEFPRYQVHVTVLDG